jgi:tRNA dimethylallyltransferase
MEYKNTSIEDIDLFLKKTLSESLLPLIAIVGPTGAGKTEISLKIAQQFGGEIINADSKQLYKGLETTTGVIPENERQNIPHHLFSYIDPSQSFNVYQHRIDALEVIKKIHSKKAIPILVGGTGLFINSITQNYSFSKYENKQKDTLETKTSEELWELLKDVDPEYTKKTDKNNTRRVILALRHFSMTGEKKSEVTKNKHVFESFIVMPKIENREILYAHINQRAQDIWSSGLLTEAKILFDKGLDPELPALKSIGIPESFSFFKQEISEVDAIISMQQKSRNYAKRQMTWWRNDARVHMFS